MNGDRDYLIVTKGPNTGKRMPLSRDSLIIGRDAEADLHISLNLISRKHARIFREESHYLIEDMNSVNGTYVNGELVQKPHKLNNNDLIALGPDFEMRVILAVNQEGDATLFKPPSGNVGESRTETNATILSTEDIVVPSVTPPRLVIYESGKEPEVIIITEEHVSIGRQADNDIVLENQFVSRHHADLEKRGQDYYIVPSPNISNQLQVNSLPVMEATRLEHGAKIRVGGYVPGEMISIDYLSPEAEGRQIIKFTENRLMTIGRDPENSIVLPAPIVSRYHAEVEKVGRRYRVRDLRSSNGTYVNGKAITGEIWVHPGDAIQIGPYHFVVSEDELSQSDQSTGVSVDIIGLNKWVTKSLNILQDISLSFKPKEFIVVVGQSGGGKSTLVDAIAGYRPATHGRVIVNKTIDVYKEFDAIRSTIGYVPQKDIIHMELTVFQALEYAARLRMPADTTPEERLQRINEVMEELDLTHRKDLQISRLSGGQQKRVSIGVELLTKPGLFFLDEPTSGLDPGMETELMRLMRRLADQGRTIVLITHATKNVMLADKVVFLARGGHLAWFGPPEEALAYFDKYRTERDRRANTMQFDHIYTLLDQEELGTGAEWAERFRNEPAYEKYISKPLSDDFHGQQELKARTAPKPLSTRNQVSALRQFFILSGRNIKILMRDWFSLFLLLATAPIMASLDFMVASGIGRNPFGFEGGNFNNVVVTLIVFSNTTMLVGGLSFMRELVKEREIYKRERMVNLKLSSYILSKMWVALVLAVYQTTCYVLIRYLAFEMPGGMEELVFFFITGYLLIFSGMMLGFFASALAPNSNAAPLLLVMFIIPQMVLSGAIMPLPAPIRAPASSSWAFRTIIAVSGVGSDVAGDTCWALPESERNDLTLDEKNSNCNCMGENTLHQGSCNFPGVGDFYDVAIDTSDPVKPEEPWPKPEEPVLPEKPTAPQDPNNLQALQAYLAELDEYNAEVTELQDEYKKEINQWQDEQEAYLDEIADYEKELTELEVDRAVAVGAAESTIENYKEDFGWTFVDKEDRDGYLKSIFGAWGAQLVIILVLFSATVFLQKSRDVV